MDLPATFCVCRTWNAKDKATTHHHTPHARDGAIGESAHEALWARRRTRVGVLPNLEATATRRDAWNKVHQ